MNRWTSSRLCPFFAEGSRRSSIAIAALTLASLILPAPAGAQQPAEELVVTIFTLEYRSTLEAIAAVEGLLSSAGSVELQPSDNVLVVRDTAAVMRAVRSRLRTFDTPPRRVRVELQVVRAGSSGERGGSPRLAAPLAERLRELLGFRDFRLLARATLEASEGETIRHEFGTGWEVGFVSAADVSPATLRLENFVLSRGRGEEARPLIHTNLNLTADRPMVLGLAQTETSETALMVVLTWIELPVSPPGRAASSEER